jgi:hypothetical protein
VTGGSTLIALRPMLLLRRRTVSLPLLEMKLLPPLLIMYPNILMTALMSAMEPPLRMLRLTSLDTTRDGRTSATSRLKHAYAKPINKEVIR